MPELMPRLDAASLAKLEGQSVPLKDLYKLDEKSGMATLDVKRDGGWALEDIGGLTRTVDVTRQERDQERAAHADLKRSLEGLDIKAARDAIARVEKIEKGGVDERTRAQIDAAVSEVSKKSGEKITSLETQLGKRQSTIEKLLVDSQLSQLCADSEFDVPAKVAIPLLKPFVKVHYNESTDEFSPVVVDKNGTPRSTVENGATRPMSLRELMTELKNDPDYSVIFRGSQAKGSGSQGSNARGGRFTITKAEAADFRVWSRKQEEAQKAGQSLVVID